MRINDLESRVGKLEKSLSAFSRDLRLALRYVHSDAGSSLTKSRVVLEKLLTSIYTVEMDRDPRKPLLGDMLADNQFTRRIERRILTRMNAIRDMGNLGPHGEPVQANDAARVLDDLCEVLDWYSEHYAETGSSVADEAFGKADKQAITSVSASLYHSDKLAPPDRLAALPQSLLEELSTPYELRRESLSKQQRHILFTIESSCRTKKFATQHEVAAAMSKAHDDAELYYRLEHLRLLGFIEKRRNPNGQFFVYTLSPGYRSSSEMGWLPADSPVPPSRD